MFKRLTLVKKIGSTLPLLFLISLSLIISSCAKKEQEPQVLILATNDDFPPFVYREGSSEGAEVVGFDIQFAKKIAEDMGRTLEIKVMLFDEIIPAIQSGEADIAVRAMSITESRKRVVDFSIPYYTTTQAALIVKGDERFDDIKTKEELGARKILGVERSSTGSVVANAIASPQSVVEFDSLDNMIENLINGNIDAIIVDKNIANATVNMLDVLDVITLDFDIENYGVAVSKEDPKVLASIDKTITTIINSGEYMDLVEMFILAYLNNL